MRILLIEDDMKDIENILHEIEREYVVDVAQNDIEGVYLSQTNDYEAILVSSGLSENSGAGVCKEIRKKSNVPILFLSPSFETVPNAVEAGADDYLSKPFSSLTPLEVFTKLRASIRRNKHLSFSSLNILSFKNLQINLSSKQVLVCRKPVHLRKKEFALLEYLAINHEQLLSEEQILNYVWSDCFCPLSNTVAVHIKRLRNKIEKPFGLRFIKNIRGFGYKFDMMNIC